MPILVVVLAAQCAPPAMDDSAPTAPPAASPTTTPIRIVDRSWTAEELLVRRELEQSAVWADGEELTFFYQGAAEEVRVSGTIGLPMSRVGDSDVWVLTVHIDGLARAVISYSFDLFQDGHPTEVRYAQVWRGPEAPSPPERAESLRGRIRTHTIDSTAMGESRALTVYLPPGHDSTQQYPVVYAADGELVSLLAATLDPQIVDGSVPTVIVVGVHSASSGGESGQDLREQEYLLGMNPERFEAHERFFVYEVPDWAERTLGASSNREERAVFGVSNSGGFAVSMGIRHPERYGTVLAFSFAVGPEGWGTPEWTAGTAPRHYLMAGTLEPYQVTAVRWAATLTQMGVEYVHRELVCGHDLVVQIEEFPGAVAWAFGGQ